MDKILFTANTDRHILLCHMPYLKYFKEKGYIVDVATNTSNNIKYVNNKINLNLKRKPFKWSNLKAIKKLTKILKENKYKLIHTHTPVGSVVTRLAVKFSKTKSKVIYTCHGFHFYKKSPIYYWLIFYPIEKYLMKYVDILVVMNEEDYKFAKKHFKKTDIRYIKGVGFNKKRLDRKVNKNEIDKLYKDLNISKNSFIVTYIAEYSKRKRQIELVKELSKTNILNTNIKILLIGDDSIKGKLQKTIEKNKINYSIKTIPFDIDVAKYFNISNVIISTSKQEGLPLNIMEAIYLKKIVIATDCRGNIDLIKNNYNGYLVHNISDIYKYIIHIKNNYKKLMKNYNRYVNINEYEINNILKEMIKIYEELI